jgi:oligoendopeptidase F
VFDTFSSTDIRFPDVKNKKHQLVKLPTMAKVNELLKSDDRVLRKNVWVTFHETYNNYTATLTKLLYYNYLQANTYAKLHHYDDYVSSTAFHDEIPVKLITEIYANVKAYKPVYQKYRKVLTKILKKQLKLPKLEP